MAEQQLSALLWNVVFDVVSAAAAAVAASEDLRCEFDAHPSVYHRRLDVEPAVCSSVFLSDQRRAVNTLLAIIHHFACFSN